LPSAEAEVGAARRGGVAAASVLVAQGDINAERQLASTVSLCDIRHSPACMALNYCTASHLGQLSLATRP